MRLTKKEKENKYGYTEYSCEMSKAISLKLGQYEDIDESPEHLAKIKEALEIIRIKGVSIGLLYLSRSLGEYNERCTEEEKLTKEEYDLLKEVLL